jgi:hypothetical protein
MAPAGISRGTSLCPDDSLADPVTAVSDQGCLYGVRPRVQACAFGVCTDYLSDAFAH